MPAKAPWRSEWLIRRRLARQMVSALLDNELDAGGLAERMRRWADTERESDRIGLRMHAELHAQIDRLAARAAGDSSRARKLAPHELAFEDGARLAAITDATRDARAVLDPAGDTP